MQCSKALEYRWTYDVLDSRLILFVVKLIFNVVYRVSLIKGFRFSLNYVFSYLI